MIFVKVLLDDTLTEFKNIAVTIQPTVEFT